MNAAAAAGHGAPAAVPGGAEGFLYPQPLFAEAPTHPAYVCAATNCGQRFYDHRALLEHRIRFHHEPIALLPPTLGGSLPPTWPASPSSADSAFSPTSLAFPGGPHFFDGNGYAPAGSHLLPQLHLDQQLRQHQHHHQPHAQHPQAQWAAPAAGARQRFETPYGLYSGATTPNGASPAPPRFASAAASPWHAYTPLSPVGTEPPAFDRFLTTLAQSRPATVVHAPPSPTRTAALLGQAEYQQQQHHQQQHHQHHQQQQQQAHAPQPKTTPRFTWASVPGATIGAPSAAPAAASAFPPPASPGAARGVSLSPQLFGRASPQPAAAAGSGAPADEAAGAAGEHVVDREDAELLAHFSLTTRTLSGQGSPEPGATDEDAVAGRPPMAAVLAVAQRDLGADDGAVLADAHAADKQQQLAASIAAA